MALFEFDLDPVEKIVPWGLPDKPDLSWFALTLGRFRMPVGDQILFRYRAELAAQFDFASPDIDYQIASIARDILGSVTSGVAPLSPFFERLASNRELMERLSRYPNGDDPDDDFDLYYAAWSWLGERSPCTSYFVANPDFHFIRIRDCVHIRWDNRGKLISDMEAWEASYGSYEIPAQEFIAECRDFSNRLLLEMNQRISQIDAGTAKPQTPVNTRALRGEHVEWRGRFESYFSPRHPDISWEEAEDAVRQLAAKRGIRL